MASQQPDQPPQPDFQRLASSLQDVSAEVGRVPNLPAVDGQRAFQEQVLSMLGGVNSRLDAIDARLNTIDARLDTLDFRLRANEQNSVARALNSTVSRAVDPISALVDARGAAVTAFPETISALNNLTGSCAVGEESKARWTDDMVQFVLDMGLPVQENLFPPPEDDRKLPMGSIAATLGFAAIQEKARAEGKPKWRELSDDGSWEMIVQTVHVTLVMSVERKRKLPPEGARWLCLRSAIKSIEDGRMYLQVLLFDERLELVAASNQSAQIIPAADKKQKGPRI